MSAKVVAPVSVLRYMPRSDAASRTFPRATTPGIFAPSRALPDPPAAGDFQVAGDLPDGTMLAISHASISPPTRLNSSSLSGDTTKRSEEHTSELQSLRHLVCRL